MGSLANSSDVLLPIYMLHGAWACIIGVMEVIYVWAGTVLGLNM